MTHGSLFSGIGGFETGAEWVGIETLWNCEIEPFQRSILKNIFQTQSNMRTSKNCQTPDMWTSLVEDFRVKTLALREKVLVSPEVALDYGVRCIESYGKLDLDTSSLRTAQCSLFEVSSESFAIFPKQGMMRNGNVYRTPPLDSTIIVKGCMLLPTPTKSNNKRGGFKSGIRLKQYLSRHQNNTVDFLSLKGFTKCQIVSILESMMGFAIGHTELDRSEMR